MSGRIRVALTILMAIGTALPGGAAASQSRTLAATITVAAGWAGVVPELLAGG